MMESEIDHDEVIESVIESVFRLDTADFDDETTFGPEGIDAESLDVVEMAERIGDATDVHIPDEDLEDMETVGDVKEYVAKQSE